MRTLPCPAINEPRRRADDFDGYQTLDIRLLRVFLAVERLKSFVEAASVMGTTPAAVTLQIQRLERTLGVRLFDRKPNRRPTLTPPGVVFRPMAEGLLVLNDEILVAMRATLQTANDVNPALSDAGR